MPLKKKIEPRKLYTQHTIRLDERDEISLHYLMREMNLNVTKLVQELIKKEFTEEMLKSKGDD